MANPDREIRIAVMGATGSGKSTFINKASESNLPVGHGLESCTSEVRTSRPFVVNGRVVTLIDTPGFDDTTHSDTDILAMIAAYLSKTYEHGARLAGVIYMHRISDSKMGGTSNRNFKMFRELCGESSLKNVLIVTNMWSEVKPEIGEARESELASKDKFFKPAVEKGARMLRHDGTLESAHTTLRYLLNSHSATLAIQQEIVNEQKPIEKTAAGSELRRALDEQADRNKEEIRNLRAEMEAAMRAKHERRGELQRELEDKQQEYERVEQNSQRMAAEFAAELARFEAQIAQMDDEHKKQLQALEGLQGDVARVQSEKEQQEFLHLRKKSEILATKQDEDEHQARELEEEQKARALAEESHQTRLQILLKDMEMTRTAKEVEDVSHAEEVKRERDRLATLEAERQRQSSAVEAAKRKRVREEAERTRLQEGIAQRKQELEEVKASHAQKEAESAAAKQVEESVRICLFEQQELVRQREEELARVRQEMEEAAHAEETRKQEEAAAAKKVEENTQSPIVEQQKSVKQHKEEERRKLGPPPAEQSSKLGEQAHQKEAVDGKKNQTPEKEVMELQERPQAMNIDCKRRGTVVGSGVSLAETEACSPGPSSLAEDSTPPSPSHRAGVLMQASSQHPTWSLTGQIVQAVVPTLLVATVAVVVIKLVMPYLPQLPGAIVAMCKVPAYVRRRLNWPLPRNRN